jgi:hypothetical protein
VTVRSLGYGLRSEVSRIRDTVSRRWTERGIRGYVVTVVIASAIVLMWLADRTAGKSVVAMCCGERVNAPIGVSLLRLPGSMLAPAALLPMWGSVAQVLLAFGITEAAVGARRTLTVAALAHAIGTLAGRYFVWYAPPVLGGLPASWRYALDTGPSAATCGLAVYVAVVVGCPRLGVLLAVTVSTAFALHPDLAGREHIVALAVGAAAAAVQLLIFRRATRRLLVQSAAPTAGATVRA